MKKTLTFLCLISVLLSSRAQAQLSGNYAIPGTFTSIAAAISSLNTTGVSGPVVFRINAGYTETAPAGGFSLGVISGASALNTITFQKNGPGANPLITAYTGTAIPSSAIQDGVWWFVGTDYVTVDGIDLYDPNTSNPGTMEFGYGFYKASAADGCQNNTIRNCVITLSRNNNAAGAGPVVDGSRGIDVMNATASANTVALTVTAGSGANSNNRFYANTIQNCNIGMALIGYAAATFSLADTGNDIGGTTQATGNSVLNFGGGGSTSAATGIRTLAQYSLNVSNNLIDNNNGLGVNHTLLLKGILIGSATSANATISSNTLSLKGGGSTTQISVIENASGSTAASNTISINNNLITNCSYTTASSATVYFILNSGTAAFLSVSGNTISNSPIAGTGTSYGIETGSPVSALVSGNVISNNVRNAANATSGTMYCLKTTSPTSLTVSSNTVELNGFSTPASTGAVYGFYGLSSAVNVTISANVIRNLTVAGVGSVYGIREYGSSGTKVITGNQVYGFSSAAGASMYGIYCSTGNIQVDNNAIYTFTSTGGSGGTFAGIYIAGGTTNTLFRNKIYDLASGSTAPSLYGFYITSGTSNTVYNNLVGDLRTPLANTALALSGIYISGSTATSLFYNTVCLNASSSGAVFGSAALYASTSPALNMRNNIFVNISSPSGAGLSVAYRRSSTTISTYSASSNNNLFYAGNSALSSLIFYDGTNLVTNLQAYKTLMATRDGLSVTENPSFLSLNGAASNFLSINPSLATQIESGALPVPGIVDDYSGGLRNVSTPDIGAWEGSYTPVPPCSGMPASGALVSTQAAVCPSVSFNLSSSVNYSNTGITYQWLASTTGSSSGFSPVAGATYASLTYTDLPVTTWYQLAVTCANGGSSYTTAAIPVVLGPPSLNAVSGSSYICNGQSAALSLSGAASGLLYQWMSSTTSSVSGFSAITGATLSTRTNTAALGSNWFQAILSCSANPGYNTTTLPVSVIVGSVPTASAATSASVLCAASNLSLTGNSDIATVYSWKGPGAYVSSLQSPVITNGSSGVYTLVTSLNTCSSSAVTISVTVTGKIALNAPLITPSVICVGSSTQLKVTDYASTKVNNYVFSSSSGAALVPMTTGSVNVIGSGVDDTPMAAPAAIGFNFNFNGTNYSQFTASPDGWVMLGSQVGSNEYSNVVVATNNVPKLYPYWDDLATGTNGYVRTQLLGSVPARTLVIEWFVTLPRNTSGAANSTFQALLYELTGGIEFRYGNMGTDASGLSSAGLTADASTFSSLTFSSSTTSTVTANDANAVQPSQGTSYLYAPPALSYAWSSLANVLPATGTVVTSTPSATSVYSVDMAYQGCITTRTMVVNVTALPVLTIAASNTAICPGGSATLAVSGANSYAWDAGATSSLIVVTPTAALTAYSVQGVTGPCTAGKSITISIPGNPTITISGSSGICTGQTVSLTASGASSYIWSTGAGTSSMTDIPSSNTTYTVTGTDALGCSSSTTQLVTVAASLSISILGPSSICVGQAANLTGNGGVTYNWSTGASSGTIAPTPTTTTTYSVTGSSGTCSNTAVKTITVNSNPVLSVTGNSLVCAGLTTTLTAAGAITYSWSTGVQSPTAAVSPTANTTYVLTGTNSAGCSSSVTAAVVTNSLPVISVAQSAATVCALTPATMTASGASTYTWANGPATAAFAVTPSVTSVYTVSATNALSCVSTKTVVVATYSLPLISILPSSATVCALSQTNFNAIGAATYTWNNAGTGALLSVTPSLSTTYSVTGTNLQGCVSGATVSVVTQSLPVIAVIPASSTLCALSVVQFSAAGAASYVWNNSGANTGPYFSTAPQNSTTYTVTGTSSQGCSSSKIVSVTALPLPVVVLTPSFASICLSSAGIFTASGAQTYNWSNAATTNTTAFSTVSPTLLSVTGTDANGCSASASAVILTSPLPTVSVLPASATVCPNDGQIFTAQGAVSYSWNTGAITATTLVNPAASSVYTVTGTDANGCAGTQTVAVTTRTVPFILISPASQSVCINASAGFNASGALSYTWSNGSNSQGITVNSPANAHYTVSGTNAEGCVSAAVANLSIWQLPAVSISASSATICSKEIITLSGTGASTYTWLTYNTTGSTFTTMPLSSKAYSVSGTDVHGCVNTGSLSITVNTCTGLDKTVFSGMGISVYPNPSSGIVTADLSFEGQKEIFVLNTSGAMVMKVSTTDSRTTIDLSSYAKGIYFLHVRTSGASGNYRLVIQ